MRQSIRLNLSRKSVRRAIEKIKGIEKDMPILAELISRRLAQEAVSAARQSLADGGKDYSSEFYSSITYQPSGTTGYKIMSTLGYAWYVEFGTGPVGAANPHPSGKGKYKDEGWVTQADGKDMRSLYGWKSFKHRDDGSTVYYTAGQPSKHFMYDGYIHIKQKEVVDRIVAECIEEVFGK